MAAKTTQQVKNTTDLSQGKFNTYATKGATMTAANSKANKKAVAAQEKKRSSTKLKTRYETEKGNEYPVYRDKNGDYFIVDKNDTVSYFTNKDAITIFNANLDEKVSKATYAHYADMVRYEQKAADANASYNAILNSLANIGGGGNTNDNYWRDYAEEMRKKNEELTRVLSADEAAKKFDVDYNEENILKGYNEASNKKFDELIGAQSDLREQSLRNNAQYIRQTADAYLDSYKNAAPTATGRGALAANALSNMINASDTLSYNDYGMMQSINALEQERQKELTNNKMLAKDYYTDLGLYLSQLTANQNAANVKAAAANMDKYATEYAASRKTAAANAAAAASKYSGLANAASTYSQFNANSALSKLRQYYNMYLARTGGNTQEADSIFVNNHLNGKGY